LAEREQRGGGARGDADVSLGRPSNANVPHDLARLAEITVRLAFDELAP